VQWQPRMVSLMKRSVACFFMLSRVDSQMRNGTQAGLHPSEQQAPFLVPMQGSDCSPTQTATVVPSRLFAELRKPNA